MILYDITCLDVNLFLQAVELDPVIVDIARKHFSFVEDKRLKVLKILMRPSLLKVYQNLVYVWASVGQV